MYLKLNFLLAEMKKTSLISFNFHVMRSGRYGGYLEYGIKPKIFMLAFSAKGLG